MSDLILEVDPARPAHWRCCTLSSGCSMCTTCPRPPGTAPALVADMIRDYEPDRFGLAVVEKVHAMPRQGVSSVDVR